MRGLIPPLDKSSQVSIRQSRYSQNSIYHIYVGSKRNKADEDSDEEIEGTYLHPFVFISNVWHDRQRTYNSKQASDTRPLQKPTGTEIVENSAFVEIAHK